MSLFTRNGPTVEPDDEDEKTVRLARRRFARRQWARRWLAWRRVVVAVVLLALVAAAGWLVFFSPVLAVSGVQVTGSRVLSPDVVRRAASVPLGTPVATVDLDAISARVDQLPAVKSVDVSRSWPDRVRIDVTERTAVAVVQGGPGAPLRGVDREGVLFRQFPTKPHALPMLRMGGPDRHRGAGRGGRRRRVAAGGPGAQGALRRGAHRRHDLARAAQREAGALGERGRLRRQGPRARAAARREGVVLRRQRPGSADHPPLTHAPPAYRPIGGA